MQGKFGVEPDKKRGEAVNSYTKKCILDGLYKQVAAGISAFADPVFYVFLALGLIGLYLPDPAFFISLKLLFAKAFIEEFLFRFLLQESLDRFFGYRFYLGPLSLANILTSLCFAALHMFSQPLIWALLTFIPSLVFGYLWQRYRSFLPSVFVHFAYNAVLFNKFI